MAVIFGEKQADGWLKVTMIQWKLDKHPNGHSIKAEKIPEYPPRTPGVGHVQMFNPKTKKFRFDEIAVPLTKEEALQDIGNAVRELTASVQELRAALVPDHTPATAPQKVVKKPRKKATNKTAKKSGKKTAKK